MLFIFFEHVFAINSSKNEFIQEKINIDICIHHKVMCAISVFLKFRGLLQNKKNNDVEINPDFEIM